MARFVRLKDVKKGDFFIFPTGDETRKYNAGEPILTNSYDNRVCVRGEYDRSSRKYSYYRYFDVCREGFRNGNVFVIIDFIF